MRIGTAGSGTNFTSYKEPQREKSDKVGIRNFGNFSALN